MVHGPVRVITVEREYGSHGAEFAHDLAARLGWRLLDSELITGAARMAGVDPKTAAKFDERLDPWYYRYGKLFWHDPLYVPATSGEEKTFDSQRMLELVREEILEAAKQGNCVLVGRGSACALARTAGLLSRFCVRHGQRQEGVVRTGVSRAGAACRAASGGLRPAARGRDPQVLPAGVVLARALSHAAQLVHWDRSDDYRG